MPNPHHQSQKHTKDEDVPNDSDTENSSLDDYSPSSSSSEEEDEELNKTQSKLSRLSIRSKPTSRKASKEEETNDGQVSDLEIVQRIIDDGQVEKLKVDQCKVYLRKHGLRLTGKKEVLVQRIKEHVKILSGGGESKYRCSSFVVNCKGDACMGDVVMFEQTVYEGYNIASRSAIGPPCGKRVVAGRIVKESYGAAKQQHTFTIEVLWSRGEKPLPPLHPLLIKGRNLYKLNTLRQRWEDEAERQRILNEKHSRGMIARSTREVRIQEKEANKMMKGRRDMSKEQRSCQPQKNITHGTEPMAHLVSKTARSKEQQQHRVAQQTQQHQRNEASNAKVAVQSQNSYNACHPSQQSRHAEPKISTYCPDKRSRSPSYLGYNAPSSCPSPTYRDPKPVLSSPSQCRPRKIPFSQNAEFSDNFQPRVERAMYHGEFKENLSLRHPNFHLSHWERSNPYLSSSMVNPAPRSLACSSNLQQPVLPFNSQPLYFDRPIPYDSFGRVHQREPLVSRTNSDHLTGQLHSPDRNKQQVCRHYLRGRCHYGNQCKFLHEPRNYC